MACTEHAWDGFQYRHSCYSDIYALYFARDLQPAANGTHPSRFPYLDSTAASRASNDEDVEYPVGTGLYMGAVAKETSTPTAYFNASSVGLAIAALAAVFATAMIAADRSRALYFALAPTLLLYAFHNWDLLAVALTALAFLALVRHRPLLAGILLGAGASTKLYPGFLIPVFMIAAWREREDRTARGPAAFLRATRAVWGGALVSIAVLNLPIIVANPRGWWYPWAYQGGRFPNFETVWFMIYRHFGSHASVSFWFGAGGYPRLLNVGTGLVFLAFSAWLVGLELRRDRFRVANVSFGILLLWLITAKVFSPQYMLWLLPFFVLVDIPWYGYVAFAVADYAVWGTIASYLLAIQYSLPHRALRLDLLEVAVFLRYAVLAWLLWMSRRRPEEIDAAPVAVGERVHASAALASEA